MTQLRWRMYVGEEAAEAESEDEDFHGGRAAGYTRDELVARDAKFRAIQDFEEQRTVTQLKKPTHRALVSSVRPREGEEVLVSYDIDGMTVQEATLRVGEWATHTDPWRARIDRELRDMRRGERIRFDVEGVVIELELHVVREERRLLPVPGSPWKVEGYVRKRRLGHGRGRRPRWGERVDVRIDRDLASLLKAEPRAIVLGDAELCEALESAIQAMKLDEVAIVFAGGDYKDDDTDEWFVEITAIERRTREESQDATAARAEAADLKRRGSALAADGKWRRAEALYSRAIRRLDEAFVSAPDDATRRDVENELVVPLLLNIAICARKRSCPQDEDTLITKALRIKPKPDAAFKAKAYVRRAAARLDLDRFEDAKADLKIAAANAKSSNSTAVLKDVQRQLARMADLKQKHRDQRDRAFDGARSAFCDVVPVSSGDEAHARKPAPLLYEKEIDDRLKAQRPWDHDPSYHDIKHAPRQPVDKLPDVLREDDLKSEYRHFDDEDKERDKTVNMVRQNWIMQQMYDTNGTGRRGRKPTNGGPFGGDAGPNGMPTWM